MENLHGMKAENAKLIIPTERFGNITVDLPELKTLEDVYALRDLIRKEEMEKLYNCPHYFANKYIAKSGKAYEECPECGAQRYEDNKGGWSQWRFPVRNTTYTK